MDDAGIPDSEISDAILDPVTSELISMLEGGSKTIADLAESSGLGADEIRTRFGPLIEQGLIVREEGENGATYSADAEKLDSALSASHNFDGAIDLVTKMDTFLN